MVAACDQPPGFVATGGDCDDSAVEVHPGVVDRCNGLDDNCDGRVDEPSADLLKTCPPLEGGEPSACTPQGCLYRCDDGYADEDGEREAARACGCLLSDATRVVSRRRQRRLRVALCDAPRRLRGPAGFVDNAADCDDSDASIQPDAAEVCDGRDNDCDGSINEDDGALLGSCPTLSHATLVRCGSQTTGESYDLGCVYACAAGFQDTNSDLPRGHLFYDDASPDPATLYRSDGCECASGDVVTWYRDIDGDGFGRPESTRLACEPPEGYVRVGSDCNDNNRDINTNAAEDCHDQTDNDCDGYVDNCCDCRNPIDECANTTCYRPGRSCNDLAPCDAGYACQRNRCVCADLATCGVRCESDAECQAETQQCDTTRGVCRPLLPCIADSMCDEGEVCRCDNPFGEGEVTHPAQCSSYTGRAATCAAPPAQGARAVGESCNADAECSTLLCEGGLCLQPCQRNAECASEELRCTTGSGSRLGCRAASPCMSCDGADQRCRYGSCQTFGSAGLCATTADCEGGASCVVSRFLSQGGDSSCYPLRDRFSGMAAACEDDEILVGDFEGYCLRFGACWESADCPEGYTCRAGICAGRQLGAF